MVVGNLIDTLGIVFNEQPASPWSPGTIGQGAVWIKSGTTTTLWFTDDIGIDWQIGGAGNDLAENTKPIKEVSDDYTITTDDYTILVDASGGSVTLTLPPAADAYDIITESGNQFYIKKKDTSNFKVIIDADGSETIDEALTAEIETPYEAIVVQSDGTEWWIF